MISKLLKLRAEDSEDIQIISAVLQDSIVPVCDMAFQPETKSFVIVAQRLRREANARSRTYLLRLNHQRGRGGPKPAASICRRPSVCWTCLPLYWNLLKLK